MLTLNQAQQFNQAYKQNPIQYNNYCRTDINGRVAGSIGEYLKQNQKAMKSLMNCNKVPDVFNWIHANQQGYAAFSKMVNPANTESELGNFLQGAIGEWLVIDCLLQNNPTLTVIDPNTNTVSYEQFVMATPTIYTGCKDYGVDLVGLDKNGKGVVGQVKMWNPYNRKEQIKYQTLAKTNTQGIEEDWIDPKQERSIYLFWFGNKKQGSICNNVSKYLLDPECPLTKRNKVVYVDGTSIAMAMQPVFWQTTFQAMITRL